MLGSKNCWKKIWVMSSCQVILTGFSKFAGVEINPTEVIVNELIERKKDSNISFHILNVSVNDVNLFFSSLSSSTSTISSSNSSTILENTNNSPVIVIHLGVHSGARSFHLEKYGYNNMTFRVPDNLGDQPIDQCITNNLNFNEKLETEFNLDLLFNQLQSERFNCCISDDPGRYLCNYIYFQSLLRTEGNKYVLFIHVPPAEIISIDDQIKFIERCVELLIEQVSTHSET